MGYLKTGVAEADIELVKGMDMTGYLARESSSEGIHDDLKIRCIIFDDGKTQFVLIVCDLLGLDSKFTIECMEQIEKKLSIPKDNIVIACIHTHSGPASIFLQDCGEVDDKWLESLKFRIVECAVEAAGKLKPSSLIFKTSQCDIGINRVINDETQERLLVDKQVGILEVRDEDGGVIKAVLINYACHPVVLNEKNLLYSKDYPHFMISALNKKVPYKNASVIFTNGCCGDINPSARGDFDIAERLGQKLADSIAEAASIQLDEIGLSNSIIKMKTVKARIPLKNMLDGAAAGKPGDDYTQLYGTDDKDKRKSVSNVENAFKKWMLKMNAKISSGTLEDFVIADIKIIRIGKLTMVTLPFEAYHQIGLKIKEYFGAERTIIICYANGDYGYFPSKALYGKSEYEAKMAFKFYGYPGPVTEDAEDILLGSIFNEAMEV